MKKILITGGAGNFGRTLASALRTRGAELTILDLPGCDFSFFDSFENTTIVRGDILDEPTMAEAVRGMDVIFHLAAVLPPVSEADRERTFKINVAGTGNIIEACRSANPEARFVFASSISVYGDAGEDAGLVTPDHPVNPDDIYAESKVEAERLLFASGLPFVNLRISAIAIPEFLDPPEPWPFRPDQKIELVVLSDLVEAMTALVETPETSGKTLIISGGPTWRVRGEDYVRRWGEIMDIPFEEMSFLARRGWLNWYDSSESQALLSYQKTPLEKFWSQLEQAVEEALA